MGTFSRLNQYYRSPSHSLAATVPLDGTDTVEGLRSLERKQLSRLLESGGDGFWTNCQNRRRHYRLFKGPNIETVTVDDLQKHPSPWVDFLHTKDKSTFYNAYNIPANINILQERIEDNLVTFLPNYLRMFLIIFLLTFYLKPKALIGAIAICINVYVNRNAFFVSQQQQPSTQAPRQHIPSPSQQQQQQQQQPHINPTVAIICSIIAMVTNCLPTTILATLLSTLFILLHASITRSPSDLHHHHHRSNIKNRGRKSSISTAEPLGWSLSQVILKNDNNDNDTRLLFKQLGSMVWNGVRYRVRWAGGWMRYHVTSLWESMWRGY
jgi:hypothetical protein